MKKAKRRPSTAKRSLKPPKGVRPSSSASLKCYRFIGISLGGGKSDRTSIAVLEYYPGPQKLVLSKVLERLRGEGEISADLKLHEYVMQFGEQVGYVALDVPLTLPKCFVCRLKCPGYELCSEEEILWMWKQYRQGVLKKKGVRLFTPYTRRCAEVYWGNELEGGWSLGDALGANHAPLVARGRFIVRRWEYSTIEVLPRLSLLRWARKERLSRLQTENCRHAVYGNGAREYLLKNLSEKLPLFVYEQDRNLLIDYLGAFDSLWAALTAFWKFQKKCEERPRGFPKKEGWIEVPKF